MTIPPSKVKILLESNPLRSIILVRRLALVTFDHFRARVAGGGAGEDLRRGRASEDLRDQSLPSPHPARVLQPPRIPTSPNLVKSGGGRSTRPGDGEIAVPSCRHRLNGYLAQRVLSHFLASSFRNLFNCAVLKCMFPWRARYPVS